MIVHVVHKSDFDILHKELRNRYKNTKIVITKLDVTQKLWRFSILNNILLCWFEISWYELELENYFRISNVSTELYVSYPTSKITDAIGARQKITENINQMYMDFL